MKIKNLKISKFKNLVNFELDLGSISNDIFVTVGKNGTGKSNLLEALVLIFRDLIMEENNPPFSYSIEYECRDRIININVDLSRRIKYNYFIDGEKKSKIEFLEKEKDVFLNLPEYIFAYYSGISNRLEKHFDSSQKNFYNDLKNGVDRAFRPLFYARPIHSNFVLLAFYAFQDDKITAFLEKYLDIVGFDSSLFVVTQPEWNSPFGNKHFWNARGIVSEFLEKLLVKSLAPIKHTVDVRRDFRHTDTKECWYLYLENQEKLIELASEYDTNVEFFKALESTYISELLYETRIKVKKRHLADGTMTFKELSEGEQQLLTVLGLLKFTNHTESLFLLDEPDTHLSPIWGHEYLNILKEISGEYNKSQMFLSSHKPTTISGLTEDQIITFEKDWVDNNEIEKISAAISKVSPKGLSADGILTQIFGMEYTYDEDTYNKLLDRRKLMAKQMFEENSLSVEEKIRLTSLTIELSDFPENFADGLFYEFINELEKSGGLSQYRKVDLTDDEKEKRRILAEKLLKKIKTSRNS